MFDINLVPEVQKQKQQQLKRNTMATIGASLMVGAVVVILVILGSLKVAGSVALNNTNKDIEKVRQESEQYKELEEAVISLESGLKGISQTIDGKNNWTLLLPHLENATPADVRYDSLTIEGNTITAKLSGKSVDSVARYIESYRRYRVLVLNGTGNPQEQVNFSLNGESVGSTRVRSNGTWIYALHVSGDKDFDIETSGAVTDKVNYKAATKEINSESGTISAKAANLFSGIETKQYSRNGGTINFDATFTVATEVLW